MSKLGSIGMLAGALCAAGGALAADGPKGERIPIFATTPNTGWVLDHAFGVDDLLPDVPVQEVSCAVPFLYVPLRDPETVDRAISDAAAFKRLATSTGVDLPVFLFALDSVDSRGHVATRGGVDSRGADLVRSATARLTSLAPRQRVNPFAIIFGPSLIRRTLLITLLTAAVQFAYWGIFFWLPSFLSRPVDQGGAGMGVVGSLGWLIPVQVGAYFGYLTFGFLADRFGRRPTFIAFMPWTTIEGYGALLRALAELELVENTAPVQLALRLLVTQGSRLLELDDIQKVIGPFDPKSLVYPWVHADPAVDALGRRVFSMVSQRKTRAEIFAEIWEAAEVGPLPAIRQGAAIPYLDEPWYCCAEPAPQV